MASEVASVGGSMLGVQGAGGSVWEVASGVACWGACSMWGWHLGVKGGGQAIRGWHQGRGKQSRGDIAAGGAQTTWGWRLGVTCFFHIVSTA